ncbi:hypothetical protein H5410_039040, partial [Solanum commersonii]
MTLLYELENFPANHFIIIYKVSWICSISSVLWAKSVLSAWTQKERAANEWGNTNISTEQFWSFRNQDILMVCFAGQLEFTVVPIGREIKTHRKREVRPQLLTVPNAQTAKKK